MHRPSVDILRAKQLKEFKLKEEFKVVTRFAEKKYKKNTIRQQPDDTL